MWRAAAEAMGASFSELADDVWEVEHHGRKTRMLGHQVELDNPVTLDLAGRKGFVLQLLAAHGLPVPDHLSFGLGELEDAYAFLERHPRGCVIKPEEGTSSGKGVTTHVTTRPQARRAALLASLFGSRLLVEPMIAGESCRALVLHGRMIHAVRRRGLRVTGDGQSTVAELVAAHSDSAKRRRALEPGPACRFTLDAQGLSLDSVPAAERAVLVAASANHRRVEVRTIYDEDITGRVCPRLRETVEAAARALGCELAGVDFLTTDISVPLEESGGRIDEINTTPGLHHHYDSATETHPPAATEVLNALLGREKLRY
jgi:cyanophycin synthetase